jgi:GTP-binding protein YchF
MLSVGIIGFPNAGKSTLFNALLGQQKAQVASYPFTTIEPNIGEIEVPDLYLAKLVKLLKPDEARPAKVTFVDIAGLVEGAHKGEGLGNRFLAHIREADVVVHVIDAFSGTTDLKGGLETVHLELVLKDFETVSRKKTHLSKSAKAKKKTSQDLVLENTLEKLSVGLGEGKLARQLELDDEERAAIRELFLLTMKPEVVVVNIAEEALIENQAIDLAWIPPGTKAVALCAKLEADLVDLDPQERKAYRKEIGLSPSNLGEVVALAYQLLDLITFYTLKGGKIVQAWPIRAKATFLEAAEMIHTDLANKFIVAETIPVEDFLQLGSWKKARESGKLKICGRDDLVGDGLVVEIKV